MDDYEASYEEEQTALPQLQNTDGDSLLLTTDHFELRVGARGDVEAKLDALPNVDSPEAGTDPKVYVFLRPGNTLQNS